VQNTAAIVSPDMIYKVFIDCYVVTGITAGPHCKSTTGRQNQDRSRLSTNHRLSWRDRSWNATRPRSIDAAELYAQNYLIILQKQSKSAAGLLLPHVHTGTVSKILDLSAHAQNGKKHASVSSDEPHSSPTYFIAVWICWRSSLSWKTASITLVVFELLRSQRHHSTGLSQQPRKSRLCA